MTVHEALEHIVYNLCYSEVYMKGGHGEQTYVQEPFLKIAVDVTCKPEGGRTYSCDLYGATDIAGCVESSRILGAAQQLAERATAAGL